VTLDRLTARADSTGHGHQIEFRSRPRILTIVFTLVWLSGWLLLLVLTALEYARFESLHPVSLVLLAGGPPVALALLWAASGKRESLVVTPANLRISRWAGPIKLARTLDASTIRGLRVVSRSSGPLSDLEAVRQFYGGGSGRIAFDTDAGTLTVGQDVSSEDAAAIVEQVRQLVPVGSGEPVERAARPRARARATAFMTMAMVGFALNVPVRLAIVDRPICFYGGASEPREPIDVSSLTPAGLVYLVPVDDFPVERARAIAEYFAATFGVRIDVASAIAWPEDAYDPERRQMNSALMLTRLEETYPSVDQPVIAIALTTRDMFNPAVNWSYVFSYRRNNRVAVVSPARMDRGCMGLWPADDLRLAARLRKMVGKNIGIMYFGLDMSSDPLSMLYANIGGPQELDAMSDRF
jgi:predicted Zn-dependent protease